MILPQHQQPVTIRPARENDVEGAKKLAEECRHELGFVNVAILRMAQTKGWLLVASEWDLENNAESIVGFANFRIKKDKNCTLYEIAVRKEHRGKGIGKRLLDRLIGILNSAGGSFMKLKCPESLMANAFYEHNGLKLVG